jgi:rhodanese-related sulfurtransferase
MCGPGHAGEDLEVMAEPRVVAGATELEALLAARRPQLVEVLGPEEHRWARLPGAIDVPLGDIGAAIPAAIDPRRPVVAYCNDFL